MTRSTSVVGCLTGRWGVKLYMHPEARRRLDAWDPTGKRLLLLMVAHDTGMPSSLRRGQRVRTKSKHLVIETWCGSRGPKTTILPRRSRRGKAG